MGKVTACAFVLVVLALAQVQPIKHDLQTNTLVQLLKKALSRMEERSGPEEPTSEANNRPDMDLDDLEHIYTLPFSNFLVENTLSRMMSPIPTDLTDVYQIDQSRVMAVQTIYDNTLPLMLNPQSFAAAMTMETVPMMFDARMSCPSTVFNQFVIRLWERQYQKLLANGEAFMQFNRSAVAVFPTFKTMPAELKTFVDSAMEELRGALMNTTNIITLALELRDVAMASHHLYYNFYDTMAGYTPTAPTTPFTTLVKNAIMETDVRCHTRHELFGQHGIITSMFMNEWEDMETQDICYHIGGFYSNYIVQHLSNGETMMADSLQWEHLQPLCAWIKEFIHKDVFPIFSNYQTALEEMKTHEFLCYFNFLDDDEMTVLREVLVRLGWPTVAPTPPTPVQPKPLEETPTERSRNGPLFASFPSRNVKRVDKKVNFGRKLRNRFI